jgi:hypothetical protein
MKNFCLLWFLGLGFIDFAVCAEEFSGTMQWSARIDFLDSQVAAQVEMAQAAAKNPDMLALLLQNAQLRGMLEDKLGPLNTNSGAASFLPTGFIVTIKGPRALVKTQGGVVFREVLVLADKRLAYSLNRSARTYQKLPAAASVDISTVKTKVTRMQETVTLLGYVCQRYVVETDDAGAKSRFYVWATAGIQGLDAAVIKRLTWSAAIGTDFLDKIEGVPLKIDGTTPDAKFALAATRINVGAVDGALLALPAGFKQVAGNAH